MMNHSPSTVPHHYTLTVMPDYGHAAAWLKSAEDTSAYVGLCQDFQSNEIGFSALTLCTIPMWLWNELARWQGQFENGASWDDTPSTIQWQRFHIEGLFWSALLQQVVAPHGILVRYDYPSEDAMYRDSDTAIMDARMCAKAKYDYLTRIIPHKNWCFDTLRDSLLAADMPIAQVQQVLDTTAHAWTLKPYDLDIPEVLTHVDTSC